MNCLLFICLLRALPSLQSSGKQTKRFRPFCLPTAQGSRKGKPMNEEPHIGKLIKAELAQQGRSITWLATQLGYSRQYMYKLFRRKWIYTDLLLKISDLLDYDFFRCYSEWREQRDIITTKSSSWKE